MRLLDRYLLRELLLPFGYCLGGFLIFWVSSELFKDMGELQEKQMRPGDIVELPRPRTRGQGLRLDSQGPSCCGLIAR